MGSTHSVHILMSINVRAIGLAMAASARLPALQPETPEPICEPCDQDDCDDVWVSHREGPDLRLGPQPPPPLVPGQKFYSISACSASGWRSFLEVSRRRGVRVFSVLHAFAGHLREGDIEHHLRENAHLLPEGCAMAVCSADLDRSALWDLTNPKCLQMLRERLKTA